MKGLINYVNNVHMLKNVTLIRTFYHLNAKNVVEEVFILIRIVHNKYDF